MTEKTSSVDCANGSPKRWSRHPLAKGTARGALIGVWVGLWVVAWPAFNSLLKVVWPEAANTLIVDLRTATRVLDQSIGVPIPVDLYLPLLCMVLFAMFGTIWVWLAFRWQATLRPDAVYDAVGWPLMTMLRTSWIWIAWIALYELLQRAEPGSALNIIFSLFLVWWLLVALTVCQRRFASAGTAKHWWRPSWPGMTTVIPATLLGVLTLPVEELSNALPSWISTLLWPVFAGLDLVLVALAVLVLLDRLGWRSAWLQRKRWLRLQVFAPVAFVEVSLFALLLVVVMPPILAGYVIYGKTLPVIELAVSAQGLSEPLLLELGRSFCQTIGRDWLILLFPAAFYALMAKAKILALIVDPPVDDARPLSPQVERASEPPMTELASAPLRGGTRAAPLA